MKTKPNTEQKNNLNEDKTPSTEQKPNLNEDKTKY